MVGRNGPLVETRLVVISLGSSNDGCIARSATRCTTTPLPTRAAEPKRVQRSKTAFARSTVARKDKRENSEYFRTVESPMTTYIFYDFLLPRAMADDHETVQTGEERKRKTQG